LSPKLKKALTEIKTWLNEEKMNLTELEDKENAFTLEIKPKSNNRALPIIIIGSKTTDEKIMVCWVWGFSEEDRKTLKMIDNKVKQTFASDVNLGFQVMNLPIMFYESLEDLQLIHTEKYIYLDELTKENLLKVFGELIQALQFISKKFIDYFQMPVEFDPSSHV